MLVCMIMYMCINQDPFNLWGELAMFVALCMRRVKKGLSAANQTEAGTCKHSGCMHCCSLLLSCYD